MHLIHFPRESRLVIRKKKNLQSRHPLLKCLYYSEEFAQGDKSSIMRTCLPIQHSLSLSFASCGRTSLEPIPLSNQKFPQQTLSWYATIRNQLAKGIDCRSKRNRLNMNGMTRARWCCLPKWIFKSYGWWGFILILPESVSTPPSLALSSIVGIPHCHGSKEALPALTWVAKWLKSILGR